MSKERFESLNTLAEQFDGLPRQAYITHIVEQFGISEQLAAATVDEWLCMGESKMEWRQIHFCHDCGRRLWGNSNVEMVCIFDGHTYVFHKSCGKTVKAENPGDWE